MTENKPDASDRGSSQTRIRNPLRGKDEEVRPEEPAAPPVTARQPMSRSAGSSATSAPIPGARQPITQAGHQGLSPADYARTTNDRADSTSVMPAVKEEVAPRATVETPKPVQKSTSYTSKSVRVKSDQPEPTVLYDDEAHSEAALRVTYIDPWSVTRLAFVVSVALMIVSVVAMTVFWVVLQITGVWGALNDSVTNVLADDSAGFDITEFLGFGRLVGLTLILSALNVVFMTALATIAAHLYNMAATILGGVEVSFSDE